jgi:erythritol transport system ATP-binding protein
MTAVEHLFEAQDITRVFPGTTALRNVTFQLRAGEVHALIGENGAGKSTLVKILAGVDRPTTGTLRLDGLDVAFSSVRDAMNQGIALIHQELQLFPDLSVAENMFVGREQTTPWGTVDVAAHERATRAVLSRLGQPIDPRALVGTLPLGLQQLVEIGRALIGDTRVLLMDEPTSALTATEIRVLFSVIRDLAARGVAIVYISHHLQELVEIAGRVSVLRDGVLVGEAACADIDIPWIVDRMTGGRRGGRAHTGPATPGPVMLEVRDLSLPHAPGRTALDAISLRLHAGEVLGIYGLLGAGRTELFESLLGLHPDVTGDVVLDGRSLTGTDVSRRVTAGLAMVPEDRQTSGLVQTMSVQQNMTLSHLQAIGSTGVLLPGTERRASAPLVDLLRLKTPGLDAPVTALSGGNQQKVMIARSVMPNPRVLLLDDPTRGVDVGAKAEILQTMRAMASDGMAVAFTSSDLAEILTAADRVIVMSRGRIRAEYMTAEATEDGLTAAASATPLTQGERLDVVH